MHSIGLCRRDIVFGMTSSQTLSLG